jgi:hypothetical protein
MKTEFKSLILAGALCASTTTFAQGVLEYDWHGDSGIYQGSFKVHEGVMDFTTDPLYYQSFTVTSSAYPALTNVSLSQPPPQDGGPWFNGIQNGELRVAMFTYQTSYGPFSAWESQINFANRNGIEYGRWALVPEPSAFALLGLGLLGLYMKRATSRS